MSKNLRALFTFLFIAVAGVSWTTWFICLILAVPEPLRLLALASVFVGIVSGFCISIL